MLRGLTLIPLGCVARPLPIEAGVLACWGEHNSSAAACLSAAMATGITLGLAGSGLVFPFDGFGGFRD